MMKKVAKKIVYLLIYVLTITPCFHMVWFILCVKDTMSEMDYGSDLYCSFVLYGVLMLSIVSVIFIDTWKRRKSSLVVRVTTGMYVINILMPSLLFFDGIRYTIAFIPSLIVLAILDCIYYALGRKLID